MVIIAMKSDKKILKAFRWAVGYMGKSQAEIGEILNIQQPAVSLLLGDKREVKSCHVRLLAEEMGTTPEDLMSRSAEWPDDTLDSKGLTTNNFIQLDQQHADVIRLFQNKKLALEINHLLVEIESMDPDELKAVASDLKDKKYRLEHELKKRKA